MFHRPRSLAFLLRSFMVAGWEKNGLSVASPSCWLKIAFDGMPDSDRCKHTQVVGVIPAKPMRKFLFDELLDNVQNFLRPLTDKWPCHHGDVVRGPGLLDLLQVQSVHKLCKRPYSCQLTFFMRNRIDDTTKGSESSLISCCSLYGKDFSKGFESKCSEGRKSHNVRRPTRWKSIECEKQQYIQAFYRLTNLCPSRALLYFEHGPRRSRARLLLSVCIYLGT